MNEVEDWLEADKVYRKKSRLDCHPEARTWLKDALEQGLERVEAGGSVGPSTALRKVFLARFPDLPITETPFRNEIKKLVGEDGYKRLFG